MNTKRFRVAVLSGYHFTDCYPEVTFEYKDYYFDTEKEAIGFSEICREHSRFREIAPEHRAYITDNQGLPF